MKWNTQGISEFDSSTDTFEEDLVFYNYDQTAYATAISSYESELPDSYLDTQFGDNTNEKNCSVGTTSADEIVANTMYYTYMTLEDGNNSDSSMFKVNVQEGHYIVYPSAWTTFADTTNIVIPFKNGYTAPETRAWRYEFENNNTTSTAITLSIDDWGSGTLDTVSDVDYWKFTGSGTKRFRFISPNTTDYNMIIYNNNGVMINQSITVYPESSLLVTLTSGTYYIKIYSSTGSSTTVNYRLLIENAS